MVMVLLSWVPVTTVELVPTGERRVFRLVLY